MKDIRTEKGIRGAVSEIRSNGRKIGFIPTMGALHQGHIELVKRSLQENDCTIVSIFVNPTQFNDATDLEKYPRTPERDCQLLAEVGCDIVFMPTVTEVYPEKDERQFDFAPLDRVMEGIFRPGHFNGVAQVVSRLLDLVNPDRAYFGEKDFQQLTIIRRMVKELKLSVEIVACPIVRESDFLAMSSRNARLTPNQRAIAPIISEVLRSSFPKIKTLSVDEVKKWVTETIDQEAEMKTEYFEIVNGHTLQRVASWEETNYVVGCIAVYCGSVRLIDNITYKK